MTRKYTILNSVYQSSCFLDMIAMSELGAALLRVSDNGYNVLVGSTAAHPLLFPTWNGKPDYRAHPRILNKQFNSTAAGRYQIIYPTCKTLTDRNGYVNFDPPTQDAMAIDLIGGRGALQAVDAGNLQAAIQKCSAEWASLPGSTAGQHLQQMNYLVASYQSAGGALA